MPNLPNVDKRSVDWVFTVQIEGRGNMIDVNITLLIQMLNFLVFLFLMNLILYRPIRRVVAQRRQFMADRQEEIDRADSEALAAVQEFNASIQEARAEGRRKIQELKVAAYEQEKDLLQEASDRAAGQLQEMRAQVRKDVAAAREELSGQVRSFSVELAQKILGRSL
jgi:F-type H+-transporting ATPase subunit b